MAKVKRPNIILSGKIGKEIHVDSQKNGPHTRQAPENKLSEKVISVLGEQNTRTAFINGLASELNKIIRGYCRAFKSTGFYETLITCFRKEELNNRYLLLTQLKELEVNHRYPFTKMGSCTTKVEGLKNKISVTLDVKSHPIGGGQYHINGYYYDVILLTWTKDGPAVHSRQTSEWLDLSLNFAEFEFLFPRPVGTVHWLLALRQRAGHNEKEAESFQCESMQITDMGSFDKKDEEILRKRNEEEEAERNRVKRKKEDVVRVKAKRKG